MYRRRTLFFLVACSVILAAWLPAAAQTQTHIRFRRGADRAEVSGTLSGFRTGRVYVLRVREGQTLRVRQIGGGTRRISISLKDPDGRDAGDSDASCNARKEVTPTVAGDYRIEVIECRKAEPWRGRFTIRVTVR